MRDLMSGEFLFVKCVKDGIPNRDPLNESDARRLFDEDDGRISLTDVSIKRDVRDYLSAKYPEGDEDKTKFVFVREEKSEAGKLLGRASLAKAIAERSGIKRNSTKELLQTCCFDVRTFGAVYSVAKDNFKLTGPVQFGWAHSLHPVETKYVQGTVTMPSKDLTEASGDDGEKGKTQGTIWTSYTLPFAVFAMPGVINSSIAKETTMTEEDQELLLEGLWKGTQHRQARGRGSQQPLFLLHVAYRDPFFRIGYLEEYIKLNPGRDQWLQGKKPSSIGEISLDVAELGAMLNYYKEKIAQARIWMHPSLKLEGELPAETKAPW